MGPALALDNAMKGEEMQRKGLTLYSLTYRDLQKSEEHLELRWYERQSLLVLDIELVVHLDSFRN